LKQFVGTQPTAWLFEDPDKGLLARSQFRLLFDKAKEVTGLDDVTFHVLRHTVPPGSQRRVPRFERLWSGSGTVANAWRCAISTPPESECASSLPAWAVGSVVGSAQLRKQNRKQRPAESHASWRSTGRAIQLRGPRTCSYSDAVTSDNEPRKFPSLSLWMEGASSAHPLHDPAIPEVYLAAWDEVLRPINKAQPLRIARKREAFRKITSQAASMEQRSELLAASLFAHAGIAFEFAKDHPDLVFAGGDWASRSVRERSTTHGRSMRKSSIRPSASPVSRSSSRSTSSAPSRLRSRGRDRGGGSRRRTTRTRKSPLRRRRTHDRNRRRAVRRCACFDERPAAHQRAEGPHERDRAGDRQQDRREATPSAEDADGALVGHLAVGDAFLRLPAVWTDVLKEKLKDESASYAGLA